MKKIKVVRLRYDRNEIQKENVRDLVRNTDFIEQSYVWENFFVIQFSKQYLDKFGEVMKDVPVWNDAFSISELKPELKDYLFL